jgi:apolipoprotein N-acyltransferase
LLASQFFIFGDRLKKFSITAGLLACLGVIGIWAVPYALKEYQWTQTQDEKQSVALLQPNIELYKKWNPVHFPEIFEGLYELSSAHWDKDIQVWPEAAIPSLFNNVRIFTDDIDDKAKETQTHIFSGVLYDNPDPFEVYNSITGLGLAQGIYFKQKLVPFGEYVPFEDQLRGLIDFFNLPNSVIRRGPFKTNSLKASTKTGKQYSVAPFICYDVVYPDFVAKNAQDADYLITISNDAWFGDSNGPLQHFEIARMRALENQKYMLRSTNNGVSGIIDEQGRALIMSEQFVETSISGFVELREGHTLFASWGSKPILLICFLVIGVCYFRRNQTR